MKIRLFFSTIALCLAFIGGIYFLNVNRFKNQTARSENAHHIIQVLQKINVDFNDIQANYAEYLLTQNKVHARSCRRVLRDLGKSQKEAGHYVDDDLLLVRSLKELDQRIRAKTSRIERGLALCGAGKFDQAIAEIKLTDQRQDTQEIKGLVGRMASLEAWLLKSQTLLETADTHKNTHIVLFSVLFAILICGLAAYFINRQIQERQATINLLRVNEERFHFLSETAADSSFLTLDSEGKIIDLNTVTESLFGYSRGELRDRPLSLLLPEGGDKGGFKGFLDATLQTGLKSVEMSAVKKDGAEFPVEFSVSKWESRAKAYYSVIIRDVTDRKFFLKTLLNNEHRLFQFLDALPIGLWAHDHLGAPYYANQSAKEIFGLDFLKRRVGVGQIPETFGLYRSGTDELYPAGDLPLSKAMAGEKAFADDIELRNEKGAVPLQVWGSPVFDERGAVKYALSAVMDVTRQKQVTESLRESEEFFRNLFLEGPIGMTISLPDLTLVSVNRALSTTLGYSKEEMVGKSTLDFTHPDDRHADKYLTEMLFSGKLPRYSVEKRYMTKAAQVIWCRTTASIIRDAQGKPLFRLSIIENITEQEESETALRRSEEKFRRIFEESPVGMIFIEAEGSLSEANKAFCDMLEYTREELVGRNILDITHPEDLEISQSILWMGRSGLTPNVEKRYVSKSGKTVWSAVRPISMGSDENGPGPVLSIVENITERRETQAALQDSEDQFRLLLESTGEGIYGIDLNGRCTFCNPSTVNLLGYREKSDLLGMDMHALIHHSRADGSAYPNEACPVFETYAKGLSSFRDDEVYWRADGDSFAVEYRSYPVYRSGIITGAVITFTDISERKQVDEMKRDLISVVSHQLKTPVAEINGYIENMLEGLAGVLTDRQKEYLQDMRDIGRENFRLISDLLSVSKIERGVLSVSPRPVALREVVDLAVRDYESAVGKKGITLSVEIPADDVMIMADRDKMVETLRNIVNNAIKFTDRGGITIRSRAEEGSLVLEVADTGTGMSPETVSRLFSRKRLMGDEAGRSGAGLGLFIAKNFMKLQNGDIKVESVRGKGSVFSLRIPLAFDNSDLYF